VAPPVVAVNPEEEAVPLAAAVVVPEAAAADEGANEIKIEIFLLYEEFQIQFHCGRAAAKTSALPPLPLRI
jgi:hypothetical protein